jgi:hypothetical protein
MLYIEIIALCTKIRIEHKILLCGQNVELPNIKSGGTYSYHWPVDAEFTRLVSVLLDYLTPHNGTERFSRNVGNYQSTLRNNSEERRYIFGLKYFSADGHTLCRPRCLPTVLPLNPASHSLSISLFVVSVSTLPVGQIT